MPTYLRPGVYTQEVLASQQVVGTPNGAAVAAFIGTNGRGPTQTIAGGTNSASQTITAGSAGVPTLVTSWSQYLSQFGGFGVTPSFFAAGVTPSLPYAVYSFFSNGGQGAYVVRNFSAGTSQATATATRVLADRAGSPLSTLNVFAVNGGVWGNTLFLDITDGATNRFNLIVHSGDATNATIVERWLDLSMTASDARYAPNVINPSADGSLGSDWIRVTDAGSSTSNAAGLRNPSVQAGVALATGVDGTAPASTDLVNALSVLDSVAQPLVLNIDSTATADIAAAVTYAAGRGDVFVLADPAAAQTVSQATTTAAAIAAAASTGPGYGAMYYPRIVIIDPSTSTPGVTKVIAPGGAISGLIQRTDASRGVWKAPAGLSATLLNVVAVEKVCTNPELDTLNSANSPVNAIRSIPGAGIVCMGARTLTSATADKYVPNRRTLIYLKSILSQICQFAVFEPNNPTLWAQVTTTLQSFLMTFWQGGGLAGDSPVTAFFVKCDSDTNTPATVQAGEVHASVGVALNYPAEFVILQIGLTVAGSNVTTIS